MQPASDESVVNGRAVGVFVVFLHRVMLQQLAQHRDVTEQRGNIERRTPCVQESTTEQQCSSSNSSSGSTHPRSEPSPYKRRAQWRAPPSTESRSPPTGALAADASTPKTADQLPTHADKPPIPLAAVLRSGTPNEARSKRDQARCQRWRCCPSSRTARTGLERSQADSLSLPTHYRPMNSATIRTDDEKYMTSGV